MSLGGGVVESGIYCYIFSTVSFKLHQIAGHADHGKVRLQGVGAEKDDVSGSQDVGLPAFGSAGPHAVFGSAGIPGNQLVGHMPSFLTDGGVTKAVIGRTPAVFPDPLAHFLFHAAAGSKTKLVLFFTQFFVAGIDIFIPIWN